ncbi:MAG: YkgJ family cysteine cluster protein [Planctomycetota bacterium]
MIPASQTSVWYGEGLRFACTRCGNCCGGAPGHVWVSLEECQAIAELRGLTLEQFTGRHTRRIGPRLSLLEERDGDCEFLTRDTSGLTSCAIHQARPVQCRTWPFWASNLKSPKAWETAARECPGINTGRLYTQISIEARLRENGNLPL